MNSNRHIFRNDVPWEQTVQDIFNYGQQGITTGQNLLNQYTGNQPIVEGELPDGSGNYQITAPDPNDDKKIMGIAKPYFYGGIAVIGVIGIFVFALVHKPKA